MASEPAVRLGTGEKPGRVVRVNGPLVEVEGLEGTAMMETIEVGPGHLSAEVVSLRPGIATAQVYEYTGGLKVGDGARRLGAPLSARLGPHLLGSIFDGLLRPLSARPVLRRCCASCPRVALLRRLGERN